MKKVILLFIGLSLNSIFCYSQSECTSSIQNASCVTFDVVKHGFPNPELYYFLWDFGDGEKGEGIVVDHCYLNKGNYKAMLSLTNKRTGAFFEDELQLNIKLQSAFSCFVDAPDTVFVKSDFLFNLGVTEGDMDLIDSVKWTVNNAKFINKVTVLDDLVRIGINEIRVELLMKSGTILCAEKIILLVANSEFLYETRFLKDKSNFINDSLIWSGNIVVKNGDTLKLSSVFFELDNMDLSADAKKILDKDIELLRRLGNVKVEIGSFTYSKGDYYLNRKISLKRSATIKEFLVSNGIREDAISIADPEKDVPLKNTCIGLIECDFVDASLNLRTDIKISSLSN